MGDLGKTAGEIAAELGVTRQAVYRRIKADKELQECLHVHSLTVDGRTYYDNEAETRIKSQFSKWIKKRGLHSERVTAEPLTEKAVTVDGNALHVDNNALHVDSGNLQIDSNRLHATLALLDECRSQIADLRSDRDKLNDQLTEKDKQIEQLQANIQSLTETLSSTAAALTTLTEHNAEMQRQLTAKEEEPAPPRTFRERFRAWRDRKKDKGNKDD
jgi:chromosome segregation ATPase